MYVHCYMAETVLLLPIATYCRNIMHTTLYYVNTLLLLPIAIRFSSSYREGCRIY